MLWQIIVPGKDVDLTKFFGGVHGEFIVDVAMSLAFDLRKRYLVMVENNGAVENLPSDAMVEIPAYITDRGPEPVRVGEIPTFQPQLRRLVRRRWWWRKTQQQWRWRRGRQRVRLPDRSCSDRGADPDRLGWLNQSLQVKHRFPLWGFF